MLIDAHTHLDMYEDDLEAALREIAQHKIFTISNSMDPTSYRRNLEIGQMCELVLPIFGVHPWRAAEYVDSLKSLSWAIEQSPILGEIGLDYYFVKDASQYPAERTVFEFFLRAAREQEKTVNLHTKGAEKEVLHLLDRYEIERAIVHWYSGPLDIFHELVAMGAYFTIGVEVMSSEHIQTIAQQLPMERLLTETDNPGGRDPVTGTVRMPLLVRDVVQALADLRKTTVEAIIEMVQNNFIRLIRGDPWLSDTYAKVFAGQGSGE